MAVAPTTFSFIRRMQTMAHIPRRALLYVPGDDRRKIVKATGLNADCICLDMEDGVSAVSKVKARETIVDVLNAETDFGMSDVAVRINSISSGIASEDISAVMGCRSPPPTLVVPKVDNLEESQWLADTLRVRPAGAGLQVITQVESAEGLLNLRDVCRTLADLLPKVNARLAGIIFGSDDFCASIGATRSPGGAELMYARQKVVTVAKAYGAQAIDMVHIDYKDLSGFEKYSLEGAAMGFTGKQVIHPTQVELAHQCFAPSEVKVKWATELIEAFEKHKKDGKGAFVFRDQMIDMPSLLQAENVKSLAEMIARKKS